MSGSYSAVLNAGFRPFFTVAAVYSVLATAGWLGAWLSGLAWPGGSLAAMTWHAHEMVFGYAMAVVAGFLLTATRNWTGVQTLRGVPLLLLACCWLAARILLALGDGVPLSWAAVADCLFNALLLAAIACPVIRVRQYRQIGILSKVALLLLANLLFYAGMLGLLPQGARAGLYTGIYMLLALILVMARRVLPFFIEKGLGVPELRNRTWLDVSSLVLFLVFWIADVWRPDSAFVAVLAGLLCALHGLRLAGWYHPGLLRQPLLWVLFLAYLALVLGFALKAGVYLFGLSPMAALHAFTYGGIGLFTLGMMVRVTLAHTGRDISRPPAGVAAMFGMLVAGTLLRVLLPLLDPLHQTLWMVLAGCFWLVPFGMFLMIFVPMLLQPRIDGQPG
ncbi:MAG TPA: NnrS family protein [Gammaproteobacteria bacterium]|nr:NnrS family protein [Gammaproteobacteria bacterium]